MSLPKILDFNNYNRYPGDSNPTTDADMQDYLSNQNELAKALTDRLWQPETQYKVGDLVASPSMPPGLVAVCVIAGATSNVEPTWTGNETTVVDNYCTWEMRLAYSYALATNTEVGLAYKEQPVDDSHLLNLGVLPMIFKCAQRKLGTLFGSDDVLPQKYGGTGVSAASADALLKALIGSGSIGSSSQPIYYKDGKLYAGGYTFRLNHNTTDDKIPVFSNGVLDYILKSELANATTGGGIIAANLAQNGYVKFSNGLILQWGIIPATSGSYPTITLPIALQEKYFFAAGKYIDYASSSGNEYGYIYDKTLKDFKIVYERSAPMTWIVIGR
jgi:hypothetical protein